MVWRNVVLFRCVVENMETSYIVFRFDLKSKLNMDVFQRYNKKNAESYNDLY